MVIYLTTREDALSSRSLCRYVAEWPVVLQPTLETYMRFPMSSLPGRKPLRSATLWQSVCSTVVHRRDATGSFAAVGPSLWKRLSGNLRHELLFLHSMPLFRKRFKAILWSCKNRSFYHKRVFLKRS